jgi:hypothetical protein
MAVLRLCVNTYIKTKCCAESYLSNSIGESRLTEYRNEQLCSAIDPKSDNFGSNGTA